MVDKSVPAVIIISVILILNSLLVIYLTGNMIFFSSGSQAVINPRIKVIYNNFTGSTTNFSAMDNEELKNIVNLTLEVPEYGKVIFDEVVNLTVDKDEYYTVNIDEFAEFSENRIEIDTGNLTSMKKAATIYIYNLDFSNPRVLMNGTLCPPTLCEIVSYTSGILIFKVSQFSYYYSAQETPAEPTRPGPGPSGPAYGPAPPVSNFTTDKDFLKVVLKQGETLLDYLKISNAGETILEFNITVENLAKNVMLSEDSFILNPGESKTLTVAFTVPEDGYPDIYTGRLVINAGSLTKIVLLIIEVKARKPLFDIYLSLREMPLEAMPGDVVEADILLYNFGDLKPVDVILHYSLRDFDGNDIIYKYDTLAVEEQRLVKRKIRIPGDLEPGFYLFYTRLRYDNETAASSGLIKVLEPEKLILPPKIPWIEVTFIAVAMLLGISMFLLYKKRRRLRKARHEKEEHIPTHPREEAKIAPAKKAGEKPMKRPEKRKPVEKPTEEEIVDELVKKEIAKPKVSGAGAKTMKIGDLEKQAEDLIEKEVTIEGNVLPFKTVTIGKYKAYWYAIDDKTGQIIISSDKELTGGKRIVRGQLQKTKTGTIYIRFKRFL